MTDVVSDSPTPLTDEQIRTACLWWATHLTGGIDGAQGARAGIAHPARAVYDTLLAEAAAAAPFNTAALQSFQDTLAQYLRDTPPPASRRLIEVDLQPDPYIKTALATAGIDSVHAPLKTKMFFEEDGGVRACSGIDAKWELIWPSPYAPYPINHVDMQQTPQHVEGGADRGIVIWVTLDRGVLPTLRLKLCAYAKGYLNLTVGEVEGKTYGEAKALYYTRLDAVSSYPETTTERRGETK